MLKKSSLLIVLVASFVVTGCSQISPNDRVDTSKFDQIEGYKEFNPKNVGDNEKRYHVREGISSFGSISDSKKLVLKRANDFCKKSNKQMIPTEEHITKPPYMINHYPNVTLTFVCQGAEQKQEEHKKAEQIEEKVAKKIESSQDVSSKYNDLMKLKKLLDEKILTPKEFNAEKQKILNR